VIMVEKTAKMFITGPKVIEAVTGEKISAEALGGAEVHNTKSGNAHLRAKSEEEALEMVKQLLSYLPNNYKVAPPASEYKKSDGAYRENLTEVVPYDTT